MADIAPHVLTLNSIRLLCETAKPNSHLVDKICVGASLAQVQADIDRVDRLVGASRLSILLLSPLFGYFLAGRATKDVQKMSATAERLKPAALDERLPIRGTGDEFDRLAITINKLLDRIAIYISQKRDFLADAAHELRTPLAAIHSSIEVALTKAAITGRISATSRRCDGRGGVAGSVGQSTPAHVRSRGTASRG